MSVFISFVHGCVASQRLSHWKNGKAGFLRNRAFFLCSVRNRFQDQTNSCRCWCRVCWSKCVCVQSVVCSGECRSHRPSAAAVLSQQSQRANRPSSSSASASTGSTTPLTASSQPVASMHRYDTNREMGRMGAGASRSGRGSWTVLSNCSPRLVSAASVG